MTALLGAMKKIVEEQLTSHFEHVQQTLEAFRKIKLTLKRIKYCLFFFVCGYVAKLLRVFVRSGYTGEHQTLQAW